MITIPIYLDSAITRQRSNLAEVTIWNTGEGSKTLGNYGFRITGRNGQVIKRGKVDAWPRMQKSAPQLLAKVMSVAYPAYPSTSGDNDDPAPDMPS